MKLSNGACTYTNLGKHRLSHQSQTGETPGWLASI